MNSLGPSDLTEVKKIGSGNSSSIPQRPPKNETRFWKVRGILGLKIDHKEEKSFKISAGWNESPCSYLQFGKTIKSLDSKLTENECFPWALLRSNPVKWPKVAQVVNIDQPSTPPMTLLKFWLMWLPTLIQMGVWTNTQYEILKFEPIPLDGGDRKSVV